ncbi:MAG TPA: fused MFS/spermidine synthase [Longimicrobiales bacterium]|nr:fused MFS/spermidine synthase [Longimicrobiales bacterium]
MTRRTGLTLGAIGLLLALVVFGNRTQVLLDESSPAGRLRVIERADGIRELYLGSSLGRQTALDPERPGHLELPYTRVAMVGLGLVPRDARILFVGLGGGAMPTYVRHLLPTARIDAVELEPRVVEVAREWFGFRSDSMLAVHIGDGRAFIEAAGPGSWDLISLDAFSDGDVPRALATEEFLQAVRRALAPGGVAVSNLHSASPRYEAMVATWQAVFPEVRLVDVRGRRQKALVASDAGTLGRDRMLAGVRELQSTRPVGFDLGEIVERGWEDPGEVEAGVLRDGG